MGPLDILPVELISSIVEHIHPSAHLSFARTCRICFECSKEVLSRHKEYGTSRDFKNQEDLQPSHISNLLCTIANDSIAAWHVRNLDFYGRRREWSDWLPFSLDFFGTATPGNVTAIDARVYSADDLQCFRQVLNKQLYFDEDESEHWLERLQGGDDEPVKVLVIALCHRLGRITFHNYPNDNFLGHPIGLLGRAIRKVASTPHAVWPPGFSALREISVGRPGDRCHEACFKTTVNDTAPFLLLPNLEKLHIDSLSRIETRQADDFQAREIHLEIAERSSSIKELSLDSATVKPEAVMKLFRPSKGLEKFKLQNCRRWSQPGVQEVYSQLATHDQECGSTIKTFGFGHDQTPLCPPYLLKEFKALDMVTVDFLQIAGFCNARHVGAHCLWSWPHVVDSAAFAQSLTELFPEEISSLNGSVSDTTATKEDIEHIDNALVAMLESGTYPKLRTLDLRHTSAQRASSTPWLDKIARYGRERGVRVWTPWHSEKHVLHDGKWIEW